MVSFRFLHRATFQTIAFFALTAAQAAEIFELSQDAWTWDRTANEREMKLSLDMSRQSLKNGAPRNLPRPTCMISPLCPRRSKILKPKGGHHKKADESRVQNVQVVQVVQNVKIAAAHDALTTACLTLVGLMLD